MEKSEGSVVEELEMKRNDHEMMMNSNNAAATDHKRNNLWSTLKPFVNGCLAGQLTYLQFHFFGWCFQPMLTRIAQELDSPRYAAQLKKRLHAYRKQMPTNMLFATTHTAALFGSFDTLTDRVQAANHGIPLTIYQEASCGLMAGAIGAFIWHPFKVSADAIRASAPQSVEPHINCRNVFNSLIRKASSDGLLALWKGAGYYVKKDMVMYMGLLVSYNRSISYFRETVGLRKSEAQLGAGFVSAYVAAACFCSYTHVSGWKVIWDNNATIPRRKLLSHLLKSFQPGGRFKLYSGIVRYFVGTAPFIATLWMCLEDIREFEESEGL